MTIQDNQLILSDYAPGTLNHPIDIFFASLRRPGESTPSWPSSPAPAPTAPTALRP